MFDTHNVLFGESVDAPPLHVFCETHQHALLTACRVLMGPTGTALVQNLVERLSREPVPSRSTWRLIEQIQSVLTLRFAHLADLPPLDAIAEDDPVWADIFHLANDLHSAISATRDEIKINRQPRIEHRQRRHIKTGKLSETTVAIPIKTAPAERTMLSVSEARQ